MPIEHTIQQGECVSSIAFAHGFLPEKVWMDSQNAGLRELRKDMHVLLPGDVLWIPDLTEREVTAASDKKHRFRRKGVPEKLKLQFYDESDEPVADCPCTVDIDGEQESLRTDGQGKLELKISPSARLAKVTFDTDKPEWKELLFEFQLGGLDPITEESGVRQRLENVGCLGEGMSLEDGVRAFQKMEGMEETGTVDDALRSKLQEKAAQ